MILNFEKPNKLRSTEEHNKINSADCNVPGTYVPNMSKEDMNKWKAKHIKGNDERVEIRKNFGGAQVVIIVYKNINKGTKEKWWDDKHDNIRISANGKIHMTFTLWYEFVQVINEAKTVLKIEE